jgi:hypothetical protein
VPFAGPKIFVISSLLRSSHVCGALRLLTRPLVLIASMAPARDLAVPLRSLAMAARRPGSIAPSLCLSALLFLAALLLHSHPRLFSFSHRPKCQRLATAALCSTTLGPAPAAWPRASSPQQASHRSEPRTVAATEQIGDGRGAAAIASSMLSLFPTTRSTCHCFPSPGQRRRWLPYY